MFQELLLGDWKDIFVPLIDCVPSVSDGKESACNAEGPVLIPMLGRYLGEGNGYPLQYFGLENSMDHIVHGVAKSQTRLRDFHFTSLHMSPTSILS